MNILEVLGANKEVNMRGELSQERVQMAQFVCDAGVSLIRVGLTAVKTFGTDIPDSIGHELKTAIEALDGTMTRYLDNTVDAATMKAAVRQAQGAAAQISASFRKGTDGLREYSPPPLSHSQQ